MKLKGIIKTRFSAKLPIISVILLTYWRFLIVYIVFILFLLGISKSLVGYYQFILYLFLAIFPWGYFGGILLLLNLANKELHKWHVFLKDYKAISVLGNINKLIATKTALTKQPIRINTIYIDDQFLRVTGHGYEPRGEIINSRDIRYKGKGLNHLLRSLVLSSETWLVKGNIRVGGWFRKDNQIKLTGPFGNEYSHNLDDWSILGSPIEGTFLATGAKGGIWREELELSGERIKYYPFDPNKRWSGSLFKENNEEYFYINGAPQVVLDSCQYIWKKDNWFQLSPWQRKRINSVIDEMSKEGLKILCVAYCQDTNVNEENILLPNNLVLLGLVGIEEWPETGINNVLKGFKNNYIDVNLINGDDFLTTKSFTQTMPINIDKEWCRLNPLEKKNLVDKWSARGNSILFLGAKESDIQAMACANIAFCYLESDTSIKDFAQGLIPSGGLGSLLIGIDICRKTNKLILLINNLTIILSLFIGILIFIEKYTVGNYLPWWFWAIINCLIITGSIFIVNVKRRLIS